MEGQQMASTLPVALLGLLMLFNATGMVTAEAIGEDSCVNASSSLTQQYTLQFSKYDQDNCDFSLPDLTPGDFHQFVWKDDNKVADTFGGLIGLPLELTEEITRFAKESGLLETFSKILYDDEYAMDFGEQRLLPDVHGDRLWSVMSPPDGGNWDESDIRWVDAANEASFEESLQVLKRGHFDVVLDAIGNKFGSDGLMVAGMGFILTSHTQQSDIHTDLSDTGGSWWNLLLPLVLPSNGKAYLDIKDEESDRTTQIRYTPHVGVLVGGDTYHGTGLCDYRENKEYRVAVSIYVLDVNEDNVERVGADSTAVFPMPEYDEWFLAQSGRLWGNGNSLANDQGRRPINVKDSSPACAIRAAKGWCETDLLETRSECHKSCGVFLEDEFYYAKFFSSMSSGSEE